jgi:cytochrome b
MTNRILVGDLPTKAFHWLLTAAFVGTIGIAHDGDND